MTLSIKSETQIDKNHLLVTADITALYTNMNSERSLECVREAFHRHPDPTRPEAVILAFLELNLKNNDFTFEGSWFTQIMGTAMGKTFAPHLANLYLLELDEAARNGFRI